MPFKSNKQRSLSFGSNRNTSVHCRFLKTSSSSFSIRRATFFSALAVGGPGAASSTISFSSSAKYKYRDTVVDFTGKLPSWCNNWEVWANWHIPHALIKLQYGLIDKHLDYKICWCQRYYLPVMKGVQSNAFSQRFCISPLSLPSGTDPFSEIQISRVPSRRARLGFVTCMTFT